MNNKNYYQYLKENSFWIKYLNRSDVAYYEFVEYVKDKYSLKFSDKVSSAINTIEIANSVLSILK